MPKITCRKKEKNKGRSNYKKRKDRKVREQEKANSLRLRKESAAPNGRDCHFDSARKMDQRRNTVFSAGVFESMVRGKDPGDNYSPFVLPSSREVTFKY